MSDQNATPPDCLLVIATGCAHCPAVLESLSRLLKEGRLTRLNVLNASVAPAEAEALGARSVPWFRIGRFEFEGVMPAGELREWVTLAGSGAGLTRYFDHLLGTGGLARAETLAAGSAGNLLALIALLGMPDTSLNVRIGIGAIIESLAGDPHLAGVIPQLGELTRASDPAVRADACHYLALTEQASALPYIKHCLDDEDSEVQAIARESALALANTST